MLMRVRMQIGKIDGVSDETAENGSGCRDAV